MAVYSGPEIANSGLVFHYDMGNTIKSWKGAPVTNLLTNSNFASGVAPWNYQTVENSAGTLDTTVTRDGFNTVKIVRTTLGGEANFWLNASGLAPNTTYTFSADCLSNKANQAALFSYFGTTSNGFQYHSGSGKWERLSHTFTTRSTEPYIQIRMWSDNTTINSPVWFTKVQLEPGSFSTPYTVSSRSNTQAVLDLTKTTTITANSLTYQSDGTFKLNGTSDVFSTSPSITLTSSYAIEAWIKRDVINAQHGIMSDLQYSWWLFYVNSGNKLVLQHARSAPSYVINSTVSTANIGTGWTHVAGVFDTTTGMKLYINGALDTSNTNTAVFDLGAGRGPQFIGVMREGAAGVNSSYFGGTIGAIKIYNRALTATEVQQNFEASRGRFGI
jgi:hypothetical protein